MPRPAETRSAGVVEAALGARGEIHQLKIPTPFPVGPVNCYLIEDEPLTLVDTGPNSGTSLEALERALESRGRRVEDLGLIVLTHQHMDHTGLLELITRRSGAEVAALTPLVEWLGSFPASAAADSEYVAAIMRRHGVPTEIVTGFAQVANASRAYGSRGTVTTPLLDEAELQFRDRTLHVLHRPGHSPTDTVLWDPDRKIAITGDHLLPHISSNPLITRPLGAGADLPRPRPLIDYIESMRRTQELPAELVFPGHGAVFSDHISLIDARLRMHERRARKILRSLGRARAAPLSAHQIARQMWGNIAVTQAFLTISEVLGHIDLLIEQGAVVADADAEGIRFSLA
jgi:glyoxylase-like metal-dependent hydrolase (beta-lactamase superfamily II)